MAEKVQVNYEGLSQLAGQISGKAEEMGTLYSKLVSQTQALAGSWTGRSATAFQEEMAELVLPTLKRLCEGLGTTSATLSQLRDHWQSVEEETAALFPAD